jgi:Mg-chelatase subunit ChlD
VLLLGLVLGAAFVVLSTGSTAIDQLQQDRADESAELVMEDVDSELSTLTNTDSSITETVSLADIDRANARLVRNGSLNVTVNGDPSCATTVPLSSIRLEGANGAAVAYEAGGVWISAEGGNGSAMQTPPDVQYRNDSLDIAVANLTGRVSETTTEADYNVTSSRSESLARNQRLFSGSCVRPSNVTLTVQSDFYQGWATHLRSELGVDVAVFDDNRTVVARLNESYLPRRVDDERNRVINMSNSDYMDAVAVDDNSIRVSKNNSNTYRAYVEPLSDGRGIGIGRVRRVENSRNVTGQPLDVVFVLDESGSMAQDAGTGSSVSKTEAAQTAIQSFTGQLNESRDRVGLVGYSNKRPRGGFNPRGPSRPSFAPVEAPAWSYRTDGEYLTADFTDFNDTVEDTSYRYGTWGSAGLREGNTMLELKSNQSRERVIVFPSDGEFTGDGMDGVGNDEAARLRASNSNGLGATIYTVGFGDPGVDFDPDVLEDMADRTGGEYQFATDQDELDEVFEDIYENVASTRQIARTPATTNLTTGDGRVFAPQIAGDADDIANTSNGFVNVNDPTAPSQFSHSFALADNESVSFNTTTYNCAEWRTTGITRTDANGTSYPVTRCTDMTSPKSDIAPDDISIYHDGEDLSAELNTATGFWQQSLEDAIADRPDVSLDASNILETKSNQAVVVVDYPDSTNSTNKRALLYRIGVAESDARPDDVVTVRVNNVTMRP